MSRDPLTGLISRTALHELLDRQIQAHRRFGLILFDIDRFKLINYGFGDGFGDLVLKKVAEVTGRKLGPDDCIGRWAGQQFLCMLPDSDAKSTGAIAEELRLLVEGSAIPLENNQAHVTASFGVACFPEDGDMLPRLLAAAEAALYHAKEFGRNRVIQASGLQQQVFGVGAVLDKALRENRIVPAFQPIVDMQTNEIVGEEALARLITPEGDVLEAEEFINVAQKLQLTYKIDHAIITSTCARFVNALQQNSRRIHFMNVSGNLLRHPEVVRELLTSMQEYCRACGAWTEPHKPLVIEVTEREFLGDIKFAQQTLAPFVEFGLGLALDDFGSGYSSFQYLADLPFSFLKIEGSLIKRVKEPKVRAIVQGMQNTAQDLGLITLAECVENAEVADIVREIGVHWAQGFYYHRPALSPQHLPGYAASRVTTTRPAPRPEPR